jgi:hypothetical protein
MHLHFKKAGKGSSAVVRPDRAVLPLTDSLSHPATKTPSGANKGVLFTDLYRHAELRDER